MSVLDAVFASLKAMSLLQLLFAFIACIAYALGQGGLVSARARRIAWAVAAMSAIGFAFESSEWMQAAMLLAFAVAGMGLFVATVWVTSRALGLRQGRVVVAVDAPAVTSLEAPMDVLAPEAAAAQRGPARGPAPRPGDHAHSI